VRHHLGQVRGGAGAGEEVVLARCGQSCALDRSNGGLSQTGLQAATGKEASREALVADKVDKVPLAEVVGAHADKGTHVRDEHAERLLEKVPLGGRDVATAEPLAHVVDQVEWVDAPDSLTGADPRCWGRWRLCMWTERDS
jgi:hypothetical protein